MGIVVAGMALGSVGLILVQALGFRTGCTLCLASAAISLALAALVVPEVRAALRHVRSPEAEPTPTPGRASGPAAPDHKTRRPVSHPRHSH